MAGEATSGLVPTTVDVEPAPGRARPLEKLVGGTSQADLSFVEVNGGIEAWSSCSEAQSDSWLR